MCLPCHGGGLPPGRRYGDPESQASASEVEELWRVVSAKLLPTARADLAPARAAFSNHQLLLRVRNAPADSRRALQHVCDMRDALDAAIAGMQFRGKPLRVSIELSPQRRERLRAFFEAQDARTEHLRQSGTVVEIVPCIQTLRFHGPKRHVLGSFAAVGGSWCWRPEAVASEGLGRPPDGATAGNSAPAGGGSAPSA